MGVFRASNKELDRLQSEYVKLKDANGLISQQNGFRGPSYAQYIDRNKVTLWRRVTGRR